MSWRMFLFYNLAGSGVWGLSYILIGYFFGKKWKVLEAWLGPTALYLILAATALTVVGVIFRDSLSEFLARLFSKDRKRKR
jgi:membrane protein DedA with SNARE-associated domain